MKYIGQKITTAPSLLNSATHSFNSKHDMTLKRAYAFLLIIIILALSRYSPLLHRNLHFSTLRRNHIHLYAVHHYTLNLFKIFDNC